MTFSLELSYLKVIDARPTMQSCAAQDMLGYASFKHLYRASEGNGFIALFNYFIQVPHR
jgi:hypothetical protein